MVLHNDDLTQVSWEMREVGDPRWDTSQRVEDMDYAAYAQVLGLRGITVERPDQVADAWDAAFAADRPVVLDVHTDSNVPPLPPHITLEEARGFMATLVKGDPAERAIIRNSLRAVGADLFANAKDKFSRD
jgi:pyruvate dehydrogenase (quinone)